ncbi:ribonuclease III [Halanaerobacter jeridensis]|uniref:Ribonuclease 3 n=1 Tax=Halanaerobacter jeridensis TaxID=706427 RepID=A0A939BMI6_9FIRM|nr:ribonuclease III [Halanaerobacter jeridensis]MBM7556595.1 ribonuclease-3 [Halanaerobacter jeridensis]
MNRQNLLELQEKLEIEFNQLELLKRAVTHKSYANERRSNNLKDNERLEFLGDAVLDLVVNQYLFVEYPDHPEGELAQIRSVVVSAPTLAEKSREIDLGHYLLLGKGEDATGGRQRNSILADAFEALIGSVYLDQGLEVARTFILDLLIPNIQMVEEGNHIQDYKTLLQELLQKNSDYRPQYEVIKEEGPDHNKSFTVQVKFKGEVLGVGTGSSKKRAQQSSAKEAIDKLDR